MMMFGCLFDEIKIYISSITWMYCDRKLILQHYKMAPDIWQTVHCSNTVQHNYTYTMVCMSDGMQVSKL